MNGQRDSNFAFEKMDSLSHTSASSGSTSAPQQVQGVSAMGLLYLTIIASIWFHHEPMMLTELLLAHKETGFEHWSSPRKRFLLWHSHNRSSVISATAALFTHANWEHLFWNMLLLWMTGKQLFVSEKNDSQKCHSHLRAWSVFSWTSPLAFLWIYLGSQFVAAIGCRLIGHCLDQEWSRMIANNRALWSWNWVPNSWRDTWFTVSHAKQAIALRAWQFTPIIGSSAAVYGIVGAHIYAALYCKNHPAKMDVHTQVAWLVKIGVEIANTPFTLAQLSQRERGEDNIDHASHFCGLWAGFVLAYVWNRIQNATRIRKTKAPEERRQ